MTTDPTGEARWAAIKLPGDAHVWIYTGFLNGHTVKVAKLNLRAGPGENFSVLGRLEKDAEVKEIRFTPGTDDHDFDFKSKHAEEFLKDGNKVKAYVQFKGRAIMFKERGEL